MSGPKHLWSGDWENESRQPATAQPRAQEPEPQQPPAPPAPRSRFTRQQFGIALGTGVATAAVAITLIVVLGSGQKPIPHRKAGPAANSPTAPAQPQTSGGGGLGSSRSQTSPTTTISTISGPSASWMGMRIVTSPNGVVIQTVRLGSPADQAGLEPGDQIQKLNGQIIGTVSELQPLTASIKVGSPIVIEVMRSSVQLTSSFPMMSHPTIHP